MDALRIAISREVVRTSMQLLRETAPLVNPPYGITLSKKITSDEVALRLNVALGSGPIDGQSDEA
jgi:hypothetical protein